MVAVMPVTRTGHTPGGTVDENTAVEQDATEELVVEEALLVEDVSIDGMCGVY